MNGARSAVLSLTTQDGDNIDGTHATWQDSASATTYAADTPECITMLPLQQALI